MLPKDQLSTWQDAWDREARLALQLMLYEYDGDLNHSGMLTTLNRIIPQRELEDVTREELSRHASLPELLKLIETQEINSFTEEKTSEGDQMGDLVKESWISSSRILCMGVEVLGRTKNDLPLHHPFPCS
jgi:hypothetical protein